MSDETHPLPRKTEWVQHIPVTWIEPTSDKSRNKLVILLPPFSGSKEQVLEFLNDVAGLGFMALSFDPWQHGDRKQILPATANEKRRFGFWWRDRAESREQIRTRVFGQFRQHMWPILGQTTLDTLRVIDWAMATLGVGPDVRMGGLSMGGDIAVAAAGIDSRIQRVAAVIATPDWCRPGMHQIGNPEQLLEQGKADAYGQYFYDELNPLTHPERYARGAKLYFLCGGADNHVPADGALRFKAAIEQAFPTARDIKVEQMPGRNHMDFVNDSSRWWPQCCRWLTA
ncbi:hypothetical protein IQ241_16610 [Romeria aff. gracilis LEGE 07310]|uniref:Peptidase S9 prolyl oligopeptidase catalytic domain-containing protein n=1 Tax=Vasconcelosia minhoensis LEGE 07310 TaxID=915328 RepID=A0A8J7AQQ3_9CYAN|nr:hypothetical protein [Romeria gracilis]MBE9078894.1 hypothetical protein [Romeria aff. gracilis LEGE 07310]